MSLGYQLYRAKYRYGKYLPLKAPVDVSLELSSHCNMKCGYCYHADPKHLPFKPGFMDRDLAFKILEESAAIGVNSLKFNWKGEGSLNPHYPEILNYAWLLSEGSTFIDRIANSNFKIAPRKRDKIFEAMSKLTKVKVSYDSFRKDVFETQRAGGNHDLTTENIDLFYNHPDRIRRNTRLVIQAVRTKLNADEDILHETKKRWPEAEISIRDMVSGRVDADLDNLATRTRDARERQTCLQAHVRIIFNHDGVALPCCPDIGEELVIGNAKTQSVKKIFNSLEARQVRQDLKSGAAFKCGPCKDCSSFETYKGFKPNWDS